MNNVWIYFGSDSNFDDAIENLIGYNTIGDLLNCISKQEIEIKGIEVLEIEPKIIDNLVLYTDDYGAIKEWALIGFSNNILDNDRVIINNLYMNNPPSKIYEDVSKKYKDIVKVKTSIFDSISLEKIKKIADDFNDYVIGQDNVIKQVLSSIYSLNNPKRDRPVSILFLGDSGIGKTETAKYIGSVLGGNILRVQFSMQQTNEAYKFIFGADHGENSLARELIRRETNVILLDEFDKVHSSFYNAFNQMLDEGVFVDRNYSVDIKKSIIICTSNYITEKDAENKLGTPIYSRFSKIVKFAPINIGDKIKIAKKNYESAFKQLDYEDKELIYKNDILNFYILQIRKGAYKNMRMLKNDIEDSLNFEVLCRRGIIKT